MSQTNSYLKVHPSDNIVVALQSMPMGTVIKVEADTFVLLENLKAKHKFTQYDIRSGEPLMMYGVIIGKAKTDLPKGTAVTTANVIHQTSKVLQRTPRQSWEKPKVSKWGNTTFDGYWRSDGSVGTGNYWLVFPLVFCENKNIEIIKDAISDALGYSKYHEYRQFAKSILTQKMGGEVDLSTTVQAHSTTNVSPFTNVDGVRFITHQMGCGGTRQDATSLCGLLAGYLTNPNVAGATVLSLGCQNAQYHILQDEIHKRDQDFTKPLYYYDQQTEGTEDKLIQAAIIATLEGMKVANLQVRKPAPISKLKIGLECGGSDGFSGISANPVLGRVSDILAALGGATILSEFPELCGVEQELTDRCIEDKDAARFLDLMSKYQQAAIDVGSSFDMNPSPGNIKDGLITDAMKSAGAAKKGGNALISAVLDYPEKVTKNGLNLLCTPGNDVESTTALAASGANIILFTTGLGTPTGNPVVPVIKVSSNTELAQKMSDIIDFDTGPIISGTKTIDELGDALLEHVIEVASGRVKAKAMTNEQYDFIPWKRGVSL